MKDNKDFVIPRSLSTHEDSDSTTTDITVSKIGFEDKDFEIPISFSALDDSDSTATDSTVPNVSFLKIICSVPGCKLQFRRRDACDRHEFEEHQMPKRHKCKVDGCEKVYITATHLRRHVQTGHKPTAPPSVVPCKHFTCKLQFKQINHMMNHYKQIHMNLLAFECPYCPEKFKRKMQLKRHAFIHTNDYPYVCEICNKGSLNLKEFNRHKLKHKKHKCFRCDAQFEKWSDAVDHRRQCSPKQHICDKCEKVFASKLILKSHYGVHMEKDERDVFKCTEQGCERFYFSEKNLKAHIKTTHEGLRFPCTVDGCIKSFTTRMKLNNHIKKMHEEKQQAKEAKPKKPRKPRKDKGMLKKLAASHLTGVTVPMEVVRQVNSGLFEFVNVETPEALDESAIDASDGNA